MFQAPSPSLNLTIFCSEVENCNQKGRKKICVGTLQIMLIWTLRKDYTVQRAHDEKEMTLNTFGVKNIPVKNKICFAG